MVDELTMKIKKIFEISEKEIAADLDEEVGTITTSSLEALNYYVQGKRYYNERKFEESIEQMTKAVEIDPEFAMAYKQLALSYRYWGNRKAALKYGGKALELVDRVSERERYLIEGSYYNIIEQAYKKAKKAYLELLNVYPDDEEAKLVLGAIYYNLEEWDPALDWYKKVLKTNNRSETAHGNIAYIYMAKGWYDQARKIFQDNKEIFSSQIRLHRNMAHTYLNQGRYKLALEEVQKAISLDLDDFTNIALKGNIYHVEGNLISARKYYMKLLEGDDPRAQVKGRLWMARLYLLQGQYNKCLGEIIEGIKRSKKYDLKYDESTFMLFLAYLKLRLNRLTEALETTNQAMKIALEANEANDQKWALHLQGLIYLKMKKIDEAKKTAVRLEQLIEKTENKKHKRHYYHLIGMIALESNKVSESILNFIEAFSLLPSQVYDLQNQAFYIDSLASAYYKTGDIEEAKNYYERIVSLTWGLVKYGNIYARSFYWLGKIYQEMGLADDAVEHYKKFLSLWKEADSGHEETADAKKQLVVLRNESQE
jgi:tetratricopeptide (TPR) repeat protein